MTRFAPPEMITTERGAAYVQTDKTLFGRFLAHIAHEWGDRDVLGLPYAIPDAHWRDAERFLRASVLDNLRQQLLHHAADDGLTVVAIGPVRLLPETGGAPGASIPPDEVLPRLTVVTPDLELPPATSGVHVFYQRAHVLPPLTGAL